MEVHGGRRTSKGAWDTAREDGEVGLYEVKTLRVQGNLRMKWLHTSNAIEE